MNRSVQDLLDVNYSISITYLPANKTISFSAYMENFTDNFKQEWSSEDVYGRMDPIVTYKNTKRNLQIQFYVPSDSESEAQANFIKLNQLIRFCYPVYEKGKEYSTFEDIDGELRGAKGPIVSGNALLLSSPPLIGLKFANLISSTGAGGRLIGKIEDIKYSISDKESFYSINNNLFTNVFKIDLNMTILHTSALGWERGSDQSVTLKDKFKKFPYNF